MHNYIKFSFLTLQFSLLAGLIFLLFTLVSGKYPIFGLRSFNVITGSMEPNIKTGSIVFAKQYSEYKIGNILTFYRGNNLITHRLSGFENGNYVTKGDANRANDLKTVNKNSVIGRDVLVVPYLGNFISFFNSTTGFILFVIFPIFLFVALKLGLFKHALTNFENLEMKPSFTKVLDGEGR